MIEIICGDAIDQVKRLRPESVECVITHPPYFMLGVIMDDLCGLALCRSGYIAYLRKLADGLLRVVKDDGYLCMAMGDTKRAESVRLGGIADDVADAIEQAGWPLFAIVPWDNPRSDSVLVFGRGDARPALPDRLHGDLHKQEGYDFWVWPTDVVRTLVEALCPVSGCVLDPFVGSGTTARVAESMGRNAIGIDLRPEYVEVAVQQ
jgi:DNA modification methylase